MRDFGESGCTSRRRNPCVALPAPSRVHPPCSPGHPPVPQFLSRRDAPTLSPPRIPSPFCSLQVVVHPSCALPASIHSTWDSRPLDAPTATDFVGCGVTAPLAHAVAARVPLRDGAAAQSQCRTWWPATHAPGSGGAAAASVAGGTACGATGSNHVRGGAIGWERCRRRWAARGWPPPPLRRLRHACGTGSAGVVAVNVRLRRGRRRRRVHDRRPRLGVHVTSGRLEVRGGRYDQGREGEGGRRAAFAGFALSNGVLFPRPPARQERMPTGDSITVGAPVSCVFVAHSGRRRPHVAAGAVPLTTPTGGGREAPAAGGRHGCWRPPSRGWPAQAAGAETAGGGGVVTAATVPAVVAPALAVARGRRGRQRRGRRRRVWPWKLRAVFSSLSAAARPHGWVGETRRRRRRRAAAAAQRRSGQRGTPPRFRRCGSRRRNGRGGGATPLGGATPTRCGVATAATCGGHGATATRHCSCEAVRWGGSGGGACSATAAAAVDGRRRPSGQRLCPWKPTGRRRVWGGCADGRRLSSAPPASGRRAVEGGRRAATSAVASASRPPSVTCRHRRCPVRGTPPRLAYLASGGSVSVAPCA